MSPAMNGAASLSILTGYLASETSNVQRSVDVLMMFRSTIVTHPLPGSASFQPSRAAESTPPSRPVLDPDGSGLLRRISPGQATRSQIFCRIPVVRGGRGRFVDG